MIAQLFARLFGTLLIFVAMASGAQAHTSVVSTFPEYQTAVTKLPETASITFGSPLTDAPGTSANTLVVISPDGTPASIGKTLVEGAQLKIDLDPANTQRGIFEVSYRAAFDDGHVVTGNYQFAVSADGIFPTPIATPAPAENHEEHESFFHVHETHIYQTVTALVLIGIWALYRRRSNS